MKLIKTQPAFAVFVFLAISSLSVFFFVQKSLSSDSAQFVDGDRDGLSDEEEVSYGTDPKNPDSDGDGYSDGVEINSGFNPLKAAPGDRIVPEASSAEAAPDGSDSDKGLTKVVSDKLTELIKNNGNSDGELKVEDLDSIVQEAMGDQLSEEKMPEIDESKIKIKEQAYSGLSEGEQQKRKKEDAVNYLTSLAYILVSNSPEKISSTGDLEGFTNKIIKQASQVIDGSSGTGYFDDLADRGKIVVEQLNEIEVPQEMVPLHIKGLQLSELALEMKGKTRINTEDPMAMVVSLAKIQGVLEKSYSFYQEVLSQLNKYGISVEGV